jgi:hypothetical protein
VVADSVLDGAAFAKGKAARSAMEKISPEYVVSLMVKRLRYQAALRGWEDM